MLVRLDRRLPGLCTWILSGWRLHILVQLLGFAGRNHPYVQAWTREITGQPIETIKRLLRDIPEAGRQEVIFPPVPVHRLWARGDVIVVRPFRLRPVDRTIPGPHSAPMLFPAAIARELLSFLH